MNLVIDFGNTNVKYAIFHYNKMILFKSSSRFSFQSFKIILEKYPKIKNICSSGNIDFNSEFKKISNNNNINYLSVNYTAIQPYITKAIQELSNYSNILDSSINSLESNLLLIENNSSN